MTHVNKPGDVDPESLLMPSTGHAHPRRVEYHDSSSVFPASSKMLIERVVLRVVRLQEQHTGAPVQFVLLLAWTLVVVGAPVPVSRR